MVEQQKTEQKTPKPPKISNADKKLNEWIEQQRKWFEENPTRAFRTLRMEDRSVYMQAERRGWVAGTHTPRGEWRYHEKPHKHPHVLVCCYIEINRPFIVHLPELKGERVPPKNTSYPYNAQEQFGYSIWMEVVGRPDE